MAKSAVSDLSDYIESIRQEAYNEGYAAAMRAVVEFTIAGNAKSKVTAAVATSAKPATSTAAAPRRQRGPEGESAPRQRRRGDNARYIAEAMMALPNHMGAAAAIKKGLAEKGHDLPYTTIRHGLAQLQARGEVSVAEDGRTWSYTGP